MNGDIEIGKCSICGKKGPMQRTYYRYYIKCECHSPNHFEIVWHCPTCKPKEPVTTQVTFSTVGLRKM